MAGQPAEQAATIARTQTETTKVLSLEEVLRAEAQQIHASRLETLKLDLKDKKDAAFYQALNRLNSAALCLSGGGIRSAAFCLGVIQALASHPRCAPKVNDKSGLPCDQADHCLLTKFHSLMRLDVGFQAYRRAVKVAQRKMS